MDLDTSNGHPDMDYESHKRTYADFWVGVQVVVVACILILIFMALTLL